MKQPSPELWDLMEAVVENEATDQQVQSLSALLENDADAQLSYITYMDMHAQILWSLRGLKEVNEDKPVRSRKKWLWALVSALCIVIINVAIVYWFLSIPDPTNGVLLEAEGFRWGEGPDVIPGELLTSEKRELLAGVIRIDVGKSANILVEAPAVFRVLDGAISLDHGRIIARIYESKRDFTVETPGGTISSVDGRLAISVTKDGALQLHVLEGSARVENGKPVNAGEAISIVDGSTSTIKADAAMFLHSITGWHLKLTDNYARQVKADTPSHYWRFDRLTGSVATDTITKTRVAKVVGRRASIQIMSGTSNRVLRLNHVGVGPKTYLAADGVMESLLKDGKDFSIEFWFNGAVMTNGSLLNSGKGLNLQLTPKKNGSRIVLGCAATSSSGEKAELSSDRIFGIKRWYHVVLTRQDDKMKLYLNGDQVDATDLKKDFSPAFGSKLIIGGRLNASSVKTPFKGRFDELALYRQALSAERVKLHYQAAHISR